MSGKRVSERCRRNVLTAHGPPGNVTVGRDHALMGVVVIVVLAGGATGAASTGGLLASADPGRALGTGGTAAAIHPPVPELSAAVCLENQTAGNRTVVVRSATLPEGGFVSVTDEIGAELGHTSYLPPGRHENVTVTVSPALEAGQLVVAVARRDTARGTVDHNHEYEVVETGSEEDYPYFENGSLVADTASVVPANGTTTDAPPRLSGCD